MRSRFSSFIRSSSFNRTGGSLALCSTYNQDKVHMFQPLFYMEPPQILVHLPYKGSLFSFKMRSRSSSFIGSSAVNRAGGSFALCGTYNQDKVHMFYSLYHTCGSDSTARVLHTYEGSLFSFKMRSRSSSFIGSSAVNRAGGSFALCGTYSTFKDR